MDEIANKKYMIVNISNKTFELFKSTREVSKYLESNSINISHTTIHRRMSDSDNIILIPYIVMKVTFA